MTDPGARDTLNEVAASYEMLAELKEQQDQKRRDRAKLT
jgi:hypothetical protein